MNAFLRNNMLPTLALATILGLGAMTAWMVATGSTMSIFSMVEPAPPSIDSTVNFTGWLSALFCLGILPLGVAVNAFGPNGRATSGGESLLLPPAAPILTVGILAMILAIYTYYRHRRFADRGALAWAIFVFVMGAPGFVGYLLHRTWPPSERCRNCGRTSPRDRDVCLHCHTEFPPPEVKGIEIIA